MNNISKAFPGVKALDNVSFEVKSSEVHSLIGQNGAGKSTLMAILNGITKQDDGEILINDKIVKIDDPKDAFNLNLSIVHQEFALCNNLSVAENIFLGNEPFNKYGYIDKEKINTNAAKMLNSINVDLNTDEIVGNLNTSQWQIIEICKALSKKPKFIVMDEPTASLDENQIDNLFEIIKSLKNNGIGIIYISHKLNEIIKISDRITVLKDGKIKKTFGKENVTEKLLIETMVGENIENKNSNKLNDIIYPILKINDLSHLNSFNKISFNLHKGEVLGLSGLLGSGSNEILRSIFGVIEFQSGEINLLDKKININSPRDAIKNGIGYIPSDRKNEGLIQDNSIKDNSILTIFKKLTNLGFFKANEAKVTTQNYVDKLNIKISNINDFVMNLSGGNQQKVVIAKWLAKECRILLFDEPTRGIDVAAKAQIWSLISEFTKNGGAVIVASNEIKELIGNCHRIITLQRGKINQVFENKNFNEQEISLSISSN
tara:strand:- start:1674 stop:3140 length:1467 start_codon:yes stop_codon:yes gene_type:complete